MTTATHGKHGDFAIEAKGLVKRFKTGRTHIEVLKGVDFDARHGDLTMVMGPSGSGKSTLIAALSGLLKPDAGRVDALDVDNLWKLSSGRIDKFRLDHCGFIFQGFNLFPALSALQQVTTVLKYQGSRAIMRVARPPPHWKKSAWARVCTSARRHCPAARSSVWPSLARSPKPSDPVRRRTHLGAGRRKRTGGDPPVAPRRHRARRRSDLCHPRPPA